MVSAAAPTLLAVPGCRVLTAATIIGETAGVDRSRPKTPCPPRRVGNDADVVLEQDPPPAQPHREPTAQAALRRIAITQAHWHPPAIDMMTVAKPAAPRGWKHSGSSTPA